jgi:hypothetical protein
MTDELFNNNEPKIVDETKTEGKQGIRSLELIADFVDGYAKDWYFAVMEAFKNELDIKLTLRKEPILVNGKEQWEVKKDKEGNILYRKDGKPRKKKKTKDVLRWTQGRFYCFSEGQVLYDSPKAYLSPWREALKHLNLRCEIVRAIPCTKNDEGYFKHGSVVFTLSKPNGDRTGLKAIDQYHLTQTDFVEYLRTGELEGIRT